MSLSDPPATTPPGPRGLDLLVARCAWAIEAAASQLAAPKMAPPPWLVEGRAYVTTGIGSSEAHARYLATLINRSDRATAEFRSLLELAQGSARLAGRHLVMFSQGLSPNAALVLKRLYDAVGTTVFTAATAENLRRDGKHARAEALAGVLERGATVESFPLKDEYTILLRVVGPLCGYVALARCLDAAGWLDEDVPDETVFQAAAQQALDLAKSDSVWAKAWRAGVELTFADATFQYAQNLAYKRVEGIFQPQPVIRDLLQYSHGPFQQAMTGQAPAQWLLAAAGTEPWTHLAAPLFARPPGGFRLLRSPLAEPFAIWFYEIFLNHLTVTVARRLDQTIDQLNWPGKGKDGELYGLTVAPK